MSRRADDFRERNPKVDVGEMLATDTWYRSPLWEHDHMLGEQREWATDDLAWCGRSLGDARDMEDTGEKHSLGGLWLSDRTTGKCATCRRMKEAWDDVMSPTVY